MERYLTSQILKDLRKKMVFLTGPRQVGKTWLAKQIMAHFSEPVYLNYDNANDSRIIRKMLWPKAADLIVFDEIHKMRGWKNFLKGIFDSKPDTQSILVTGSARFDTFRQSGDSLAGRYLSLRLHPFSVAEIIGSTKSGYHAVEMLTKYGGFPEPLLSALSMPGEEALTDAARWRNQYFTDIIRDDIFDFSRINEIKTMKLLLEMLRSRVGAPVSYLALSEDLQVSPNTVKKYIQILESLYIIFLIRPYNKNISRGLLREPKLYFFDTGYIESEGGARLENVVALSILKHVNYLYDVKGVHTGLYYLKTKEKKEVDFALTINDKLKTIIEVKTSEARISPNLKYFHERYEGIETLQLVHNLSQEEEHQGIKMLRLADWLSKLEA